MFRLAHISDVHLGPLPSVRLQQLLSKRITGYINWQRHRGRAMNDGTLEGLVTHLKNSAPNHIAVTGDLVNIALPEEISRGRIWLDALGSPENVSFVPGNHDTYLRSSMGEIGKAWQPFMAGDPNCTTIGFPYQRVRENIALIGVNSGEASMPFTATGTFRYDQSVKLAKLLDKARAQGLFRVVMIHHPPFVGATSRHKRLIGAELFREVIKKNGAELVLHGHTHIESYSIIEGPDNNVPVIGVPSASASKSTQSKHQKKPAAQYNLFAVQERASGWEIQMQQFGYGANHAGVQLIKERDL